MNRTFSHQLSMIPHMTALAENAECMAYDYLGYELLEVDDTTGEILIGKPCAAVWAYTKSQHLLILCGAMAIAWQQITVMQV